MENEDPYALNDADLEMWYSIHHLTNHPPKDRHNVIVAAVLKYLDDYTEKTTTTIPLLAELENVEKDNDYLLDIITDETDA